MKNLRKPERGVGEEVREAVRDVRRPLAIVATMPHQGESVFGHIMRIAQPARPAILRQPANFEVRELRDELARDLDHFGFR